MIMSFRNNRTLGQIAQSFTQAVEDLKSLRQRNSDVIVKNTDSIQKIEMRNLELGAENVKAAKFQGNLERLLGE